MDENNIDEKLFHRLLKSGNMIKIFNKVSGKRLK